MSYNLVSPHYTTTKAKSGGRERSRMRWRRKRKRRKGGIRGKIRMGKIQGGKPMGCVIREGWSRCPTNDTV